MSALKVGDRVKVNYSVKSWCGEGRIERIVSNNLYHVRYDNQRIGGFAGHDLILLPESVKDSVITIRRNTGHIVEHYWRSQWLVRYLDYGVEFTHKTEAKSRLFPWHEVVRVSEDPAEVG